MSLVLIFVSFFFLLLLGVPIAFVIGVVSLGYLIIA